MLMLRQPTAWKLGCRSRSRFVPGPCPCPVKVFSRQQLCVSLPSPVDSSRIQSFLARFSVAVDVWRAARLVHFHREDTTVDHAIGTLASLDRREKIADLVNHFVTFFFRDLFHVLIFALAQKARANDHSPLASTIRTPSPSFLQLQHRGTNVTHATDEVHCNKNEKPGDDERS